jgi:spore germination cell wall hydrolase CwlJ-like protein
MTYDQNDLDLLALCLFREGRGEGELGCRAIAHVIYNRVNTWCRSSDPEAVHRTIMGKNQFSSMSVPSDPEFSLYPQQNDESYQMCVQVAKTVLGGADIDVTLGAHYYANLLDIAKDSWFTRNIVNRADVHKELAQIGKHTFYL